MFTRTRIVGLISALLLSLALSPMATAQEEEPPITGSQSVNITVACSTTNTLNSVSISAPGGGAFDGLDPNDADQLALRSTAEKALRVNMNISSCQTGAWHVDASITNFTSGTNTIDGKKFRLPIGGTLSSTTAATVAGDVPVPGVVAPATSFVTFSGAASPFTSSHAIAIGAAGSTGNMYMDFTGQLTNLDPATAEGTYTATVTVTFSPGAP